MNKRAKNLEPKILFEDPHLIVLSKPAGLLSQGGPEKCENLVDWLRRYVGRHYIGLIHRLDRNVSGVMVVAKRSKAAARLTLALQEGQLVRLYRGWIHGNMRKKQTWRQWILKDPKKNQVRVVPRSMKGAKEAVLHVRPLQWFRYEKESITLAEFTLETGRSHQIRIQAAHAGYPIVGDSKYGKERKRLLHRPALHSYEVKFPHPMTSKKLTFRSPMPPELVFSQSRK